MITRNSNKQDPNDGPPLLVPHHWGSTIKFNLKSLCRQKKEDRKVTAEIFAEGSDSDVCCPLYLYLMAEDRCCPWIVAYRGHREVLKSPIVMEGYVNQLKGSIVQTVFSNTANRKPDDPITRHYSMEFHTDLEAQSFALTMSLMYNEKRKGKKLDETKSGKSNSERKGEDSEDDESIDPEVFPPDEYFQNTQDPFSGYFSD